jgi:hypothetical protein
MPISKQMLDLKYNIPILEKGLFDKDFIIQGIAINSTTTENNHKFLPEELRKSAQSLNGVPLLIDHKNEVNAIKGRVIHSEFDENNKNIPFKAVIKDNSIQQLINDGLLNTVSVGAAVEDIEEDNGFLIPKGIRFKELSLVAVPADSNATFTVALQEAYKLLSSPIEENPNGEIKTKEVSQMTQEEVKASETPKVEEKVEKVEEKPKADESILKELAEIKKQLEEMKEMKKIKEDIPDELKPKEEPKKEEPTEEDEQEEKPEEKSTLKFTEGFGSIKGGAITANVFGR